MQWEAILERDTLDKGPGKSYKVLVVDDSPLMHQVYKSSFMDYQGFSLVYAKSGVEALDLLAWEDHIDLIVLDIHMPMMNGIQFIEKIKPTDKYKDIPIIVITTEGEEEFTKKAMELGAKGYLTKPFKKEKLYKLVNKIIEDIG